MPANPITFTTTDSPSAEMLAAVDAGLDHYNRDAAPLADVKPLASIAVTESGVVLGGAVGRTWGACFELLQLWVSATHRRQGVGSRLLEELEARATARGCRIFYLTTLSFQAPDFYRRHGYAVLAEIGGHPGEIVKYLMQKSASVPGTVFGTDVS